MKTKMRQKQFYFLAFLISVLILSCETRFADDIRTLVTGQVIDETGVGVPDVDVSVYTGRSSGSIFSGSSSSDMFLLGRNLSLSDGSFEVVSLFDRSSDFSIEFNGGEFYTTYAFLINTQDFTPEDLIFDLEDITLRKVGVVHFTISRESDQGNEIAYDFNFTGTECVEVFEDDLSEPIESYCHESRTLSRTLNDNRPNIDGSFSAPYNTEVEFTYSINGADPVTEVFTVNQNTYDINFTY